MFGQCMAVSLEFTGSALQVLLNQRSHSFAGMYKSAAIIHLTSQIAYLLNFLPSLLGRIDARSGFSVLSVAFASFSAVLGWQALTLPKVSETGDSEDPDVE